MFKEMIQAAAEPKEGFLAAGLGLLVLVSAQRASSWSSGTP